MENPFPDGFFQLVEAGFEGFDGLGAALIFRHRPIMAMDT